MRYGTPKFVLIVTVAYLVVFFALASGVFNAIIEGGRQSARSLHLTFKVSPNNRGNNCYNNDSIYGNGWSFLTL